MKSKSRTKYYKFGPHKCRAYYKPVGQGYEVGLVFGRKHFFVGNFVHYKEANEWWTYFNKEIASFGQKYWLSSETPINWYREFLSHHLYKNYYSWLDKKFTRYEKNYVSFFKKDEKKYKQLSKKWSHEDHYSFQKAA